MEEVEHSHRYQLYKTRLTNMHHKATEPCLYASHVITARQVDTALYAHRWEPDVAFRNHDSYFSASSAVSANDHELSASTATLDSMYR
jgi:hypothetical protein